MHNFTLIEEYYNKFVKRLEKWIPDSIYLVNLDLLHRYDLLHFGPQALKGGDLVLDRYFHIAETPDKLTLVNDEFVIWIYPSDLNGDPATYVLIALNRQGVPQLETAFIASGIYNQSGLIMKLLEGILSEIHDNEQMLSKMEQLG